MSSNKPLHVVQFGAGNALYGAERWILALVRYLDPAQVRTTIVTLVDGPDCPTALVDEAHARGITTQLIDAPGRLSFSGVKELARFCREEGVDIVHSHGYKPDVYGLLARRSGGYKLLATPHGWSHDPAPKEALYEWINRHCFPYCDAVAPLSEALAADLSHLRMGSTPVQLIINGVDTEEVINTAPAHDPALLPEQTFTIGYVGQLIPRKGLLDLLEALAILHHKLDGVPWRCLLLGEGEQRTELVAAAVDLGIADRLILPGFRTDRLALLKRLDAFVLPSYVEGIPRCLMEALTAGVPSLASDIDGVRDLLVDDDNGNGPTGYRFPAGDSAQMAAHLLDIYHQPQAAQQRAAAGKARVERCYSARRMATEYTQLYRRLVSGEPHADQ